MDDTMYALIASTREGLQTSSMRHRHTDVWEDIGCGWTGYVVGYLQGHRVWSVEEIEDRGAWPVVAGQGFAVRIPGTEPKPTEADEAKARIDWLVSHGYAESIWTHVPSGAVALIRVPESRQ